MQEIKFRLVNPGLTPRRTKLEMPGWAGEPEPRKDGSHEYAWPVSYTHLTLPTILRV